MNVLLTGAAAGIGRATVEQLLVKDHEVVAVDIGEAGLGELPEESKRSTRTSPTRDGYARSSSTAPDTTN
ncbi:SDR family NAD(P)-dependent oxidoreductase [Halorussus aquaticus]|uniref:SDR family NAD(P)-dependent oxidoreductase n=1 Tax=Halorussus aquaticus TaxID=2953748 RepID=A0ABD5Q8N9_9EURY|nr:SDR family NAD(P)-dependent oxidoreductase [Halorussus aquaticus]